MRHLGFLTIVVLSTACGQVTPGGLTYDVSSGTAPADLAEQLDKAWTRARGVSEQCRVMWDKTELQDLHDAIRIEVIEGPLEAPGLPGKFYGLSWPSTSYVQVALLNGRVAATAHEFFHLMIAGGRVGQSDGDGGHIHRCWKFVNGDTP